MSATAVAALDLENYARMAQRMYPGSRCLAICDSDGELMKASDPEAVDWLQRLRDIAGAWPDSVAESLEVNLDGDTVSIMNLQPGTEQPRLFLVWRAETLGSKRAADRHDALLSLVVCIRNELQLQNELDSMALELAERYEELNLVYHTEDQVSYFREGREAFRALVQNCSDYLNAGLAIVYLRDKGVLAESRSKIDGLDALLVQSMLETGLYAKAHDGKSIQFLNNDGTGDDDVAVPVPCRLMIAPIIGGNDAVDGVIAIAKSLSERPFTNSDKNLLAVMARKAAKIVQGSYDGLTGLLNRASFEQLVNHELQAIRDGGGHHCLIHVNLDQLHRVNETLGHEAGDMVIQALARLMVEQLRDSDQVARLGGDEIAAVLHGCDANKAAGIAKQLLKRLSELRLEWQDMELPMTASAGVAVLDHSTGNGEQALKQALIACDQAKEGGGNTVCVYAPGQTKLMEREAHMWMVGTVHTALRNGDFLLYGQPIVPLRQGGTPHIEVLLRLQDQDKIVAPHAFLPASERYQLMTAIDRWVIENALLQIGLYLDSAPRHRPVFGINLSGQSFCAPEFLEFAASMLAKSEVPPELICFEITETAAVSNMDMAKQFIAGMRELGCVFALDDFGAGLSSFGYLKSFDVQYLKIDGALVKEIEHDNVSAAMVESVHQIGHVMGLQTIAEFVETAACRALLKKMGVDYVQGYLLGKPRPLAEQLAEIEAGPALAAI